MVTINFAAGDESVFWDIQTLIWLSSSDMVEAVENAGVTISLFSGGSQYTGGVGGTILWNRNEEWTYLYKDMDPAPGWNHFPPLSLLAHEMLHAYKGHVATSDCGLKFAQEQAEMVHENVIRYAFYTKHPDYNWVDPRPAYGYSNLARTGFKTASM